MLSCSVLCVMMPIANTLNRESEDVDRNAKQTNEWKNTRYW